MTKKTLIGLFYQSPFKKKKKSVYCHNDWSLTILVCQHNDMKIKKRKKRKPSSIYEYQHTV